VEKDNLIQQAAIEENKVSLVIKATISIKYFQIFSLKPLNNPEQTGE